MNSSNFLKKIFHRTFLILILSILGCSQDAQTQTSPADTKKFNSIENYTDLLSLEQEGIIPSKLSQMDSDDTRYDKESISEIRSKKDKILIVGDSWAVFPCLYGSLPEALEDANASIINDSRCLRTSKLGAEASEWLTLKQHARAVDFIRKNSKIKYIYLSLGGNDLMARWNVNISPEDEQKLFQQTFSDIQKVIQAYISIRPGIKVILSGYDFPHFRDNQPIGMYKKIYESMGKPNFRRINQTLTDFSQFLVPIANGKNIFYIHHLGLSQYYDGVKEYGMPAHVTLSPDQISPMNNPGRAGGNPDYPTSLKSMINWLFLARDSFHLHHTNYVYLMKHTYDNVLSHVID